MTSTKLNIIVVTWDALEYTKLTIRSLLATTAIDYILTIVDNGSKADTVDYLKTLKPKNYLKKINIILNGENKGYGGAISQGFDADDCEYFCVANNDIVFTNDWTTRLIKHLEENPKLGLIGTLRPADFVPYPNSSSSTKQIVDSIPNSDSPQKELDLFTNQVEYQDFAKLITGDFDGKSIIYETLPFHIVTCCAIGRKSIVESVGGVADLNFQKYGSEDTDLSWRLITNGYQVDIATDVYIHHFRHKSIDSNNLDRSKYLLQNNRKFYLKWESKIREFLIDESKKRDIFDAMSNEKVFDFWFLRRLNENINFWDTNSGFVPVDKSKFLSDAQESLQYNIVINKPIGNLYRKNHTLILCKQNDKYILGQKKNFYPEGISRMLGGGIKQDEEPIDAAIRELQEETGVEVRADELTKLATIQTNAQTVEGQKSMMTHIFYCNLDNYDNLVAGDDVSGLVYLTENEFKLLIDKMMTLEGTYYGDGYDFEWRDYGMIYGYHHLIALCKIF